VTPYSGPIQQFAAAVYPLRDVVFADLMTPFLAITFYWTLAF
jgi:hypothetical protein